MKSNEYIKYYVTKDIILAIVLIISGYAWYQLLVVDQTKQDEMSGDNVAELVPLNSTNES